MVKRNGDDISVRFGIDDKDFLVSMEKIEKAGTQTLQKLASEGKKTSAEYQDLEKDLKDVRDGMEKLRDANSKASKSSSDLIKRLDGMGISTQDLTARMGPMGRVIASIGPASLVAAGGVAVLVGGVVALIKLAEQADKNAARLKAYASQAAGAGFDVEEMRAFELQLVRNGQSMDEFAMAAQRLQSRIAEAGNKQGELYTALKDTHPELLKQLQGTRSQAEAVFVLASALASEEDRLERNRIAKAALDDEGIKLQKTLLDLAGKGLPGIKEEARKAGVAITDDLIAPYADLQAANEELAMALENQSNIALMHFAVLTRDAKAGLTDLLAGMNQFLAKQNDVYGVLSLPDLRKERGELYERINRDKELLAMDDPYFNVSAVEADLRRAEEKLAALEAQIKAREDELYLTNEDNPDTPLTTPVDPSLSGLGGKAASGVEDFESRARKIDREREQAARKREAAEREAARLLVAQGDISRALEQKTEQINALKEQGLLTDEQAAQAIEKAREALEKQTPQYRAHLQILERMGDIGADVADAAEAAADEAERRADAEARVLDLQRRHALDLAQIVGDRTAIREADIESRAQDYMGADDRLSYNEARRRAEVEVKALQMAEVQAAAGDVFARGAVEGFTGGDWKGVLLDGVTSAVTQGMYNAAISLFNLLIQNLPGIFGGAFSGVNVGFGIDLGSLFGSFAGSASGSSGNFMSNLPRHHSGKEAGIGPTEYLAVLQKGEQVSREDNGPAMVFSPIINAPGASAEGLAAVQDELARLRGAFVTSQKAFPQAVVGVMDKMRQNRGY